MIVTFNGKIVNFGGKLISIGGDVPPTPPGPEPTQNTYTIFPQNASLEVGTSTPTGWFVGAITETRLNTVLTEEDSSTPSTFPNMTYSFTPQSFADKVYMKLVASGCKAGETLAGIDITGENPVLAIAFSDINGNVSEFINIGRDGSSGSGVLKIRTAEEGSVDSKAHYTLPSVEITSYLSNIDITKICKVHISLLWSDGTSWKPRTKGLKIYSFIIADTPITEDTSITE
ncbi:MAG: hypothetical protein MJZ34_08175 [Paludibacteraceae bacterium]|nr:hypothetical protein [Paludibacteraceae bacterium]